MATTNKVESAADFTHHIQLTTDDCDALAETVHILHFLVWVMSSGGFNETASEKVNDGLCHIIDQVTETVEGIDKRIEKL